MAHRKEGKRLVSPATYLWLFPRRVLPPANYGVLAGYVFMRRAGASLIFTLLLFIIIYETGAIALSVLFFTLGTVLTCWLAGVGVYDLLRWMRK